MPALTGLDHPDAVSFVPSNGAWPCGILPATTTRITPDQHPPREQSEGRALPSDDHRCVATWLTGLSSAAQGSTIRGEIMNIRSTRDTCRFLKVNSAPSAGMSPRMGTLLVRSRLTS